MRQRIMLFGVVGVCALLLGVVTPVSADPINDTTLHLQCVPSTSCSTGTVAGGGTILLSMMGSPTWTISRTGSGTLTGNLWFAVLVPSATPDGLTFAINGNSASQFAGTYSSGDLITGFLNLTKVTGGGPATPISALQLQAGLTFDVYLVNVGSITFVSSGPTASRTCTNQNPCGPFSFDGSFGLPVSSVIYPYLVATSGVNAGKVIDTGAPSSSIAIVPEPGTLVLFGTGLLAIAGGIRRKLSEN